MATAQSYAAYDDSMFVLYMILVLVLAFLQLGHHPAMGGVLLVAGVPALSSAVGESAGIGARLEYA